MAPRKRHASSIMTTFRIPEALMAHADARAEALGMSRNRFIEELLMADRKDQKKIRPAAPKKPRAAKTKQAETTIFD